MSTVAVTSRAVTESALRAAGCSERNGSWDCPICGGRGKLGKLPDSGKPRCFSTDCDGHASSDAVLEVIGLTWRALKGDRDGLTAAAHVNGQISLDDAVPEQAPAEAVSSLSAEHKAEILSGSSVAPDVADARGYRTLSDTPGNRAMLAELGFSRPQAERGNAYPMLYLPIYGATGEQVTAQIKPNVPRTRQARNGKVTEIKYETPAGSAVHIDVPPFTQQHVRDVSVPLWITEGIKKVDALVSRELAAIGLTGVFNWRNREGTLGDWEDIPLKGRQVTVCFDADAAKNMNVLRAMNRLGAWLKSKGATPHYLIVPPEVNGTQVKGVDDYFAAGGTPQALQDAATRESPESSRIKDASFSDSFLAADVADDVLDGRYRYVTGLGWMRWDGRRWKECDQRHPAEALREWAVTKYRAALGSEQNKPGETPREVLEGWRELLKVSKQAAVMRLAAGIEGVLTDATDMDTHHDLLNVHNGVVDLRAGELRGHDPDLLMTKVTRAEYRRGYRHVDWSKALEAIPGQARDWYQVRMGQASTGHMTPDDLLIVAHGDGSNGKTTVVEPITQALGDYYELLSDRVLMANPDAHPTELMDLRGARLAVLEETPEARRLDTQRLKKTVGTPRIKARHIRQDSVTFDATHSLFINTNFKPDVAETDHGTWRRLALLPFPYTYRKPGELLSSKWDREGDPTLRDRCKNDPDIAAAALTWLVEGAVSWYAGDKVMPQLPSVIEEATRGWRVESDSVLAFIDDRLIFDPNAHIASVDLTRELSGWLQDRNMTSWNDKTITTRFGGHEEFKRRRVVKTKARSRAGQSRPVVDLFTKLPTLPEGPYPRWAGIRFRTNADAADTAQEGVPGVPGTPVNGETTRTKSVIGSTGNTGNASENTAGQTANPADTLPIPCTCGPGAHDPFCLRHAA